MANLKALGRTAPALNRSYIYDSAGDGDRTGGSYLSQTLGGKVKSHPANFNSLSINNELEIPQEGELDLYGTRPASAVSVSEVSKSTHKDTDYLADQTSESYSNQKTFSRGHMPTWRKMLLDPELAGEILSRQWPRVSLRASYKRKAPYVTPDEYDTEDEIKKNDKDTGITKRSLVTLTFIIIGIIIVAAAAIPVLLHLQLSESNNVQVNKSLSVNKPYDNSLFSESTTINILSASIKLSSLDSKISSYMSSSEQTPSESTLVLSEQTPSESSLVHSTADMHKSNDFSARTTAASSEIAMSKIQSFTTINSLGDISTESYLKQSLETTSKRQSVSTMSNSDAIIKESQSSVIKTVDFSTLLASRVITTSKSQPVTQVSNTDAITNESILVKSSAITDTPNDFFTAKSFPSREITTSNSLLVTSMYNSYSITSDSNFERSSAIMNDDFSSSTITALRDITISNGQSFASIYSSDEIKSEISSASQLPPSKNASSKITTMNSVVTSLQVSTYLAVTTSTSVVATSNIASTNNVLQTITLAINIQSIDETTLTTVSMISPSSTFQESSSIVLTTKKDSIVEKVTEISKWSTTISFMSSAENIKPSLKLTTMTSLPTHLTSDGTKLTVVQQITPSIQEVYSTIYQSKQQTESEYATRSFS